MRYFGDAVTSIATPSTAFRAAPCSQSPRTSWGKARGFADRAEPMRAFTIRHLAYVLAWLPLFSWVETFGLSAPRVYGGVFVSVERANQPPARRPAELER